MRPSFRLAVLLGVLLAAAPALRAQSAGGSAVLDVWTEDDTAPTRGNDLARIVRDGQGRMIVAESWQVPTPISYDPYATKTLTRLHRWNGQRWSHLDVRVPSVYIAGTIDPAKVHALTLAENDTLVAATNVGLVKWTGSAWASMYIAYAQAVAQGSPVTTPTGEITRVVYSAAERRLYVSGDGFKVERPAEGSLIRIVSGQNGVGYLDLATRRWVGVGGGTQISVADLTLGADGRVYAAGSFTSIGGQGAAGFEAFYPYVAPTAARHVARYTGSGTAWEALGAGPGDAAWSGSPAAMRVAPDGALHVFGNYFDASSVRQGVDYRLDSGNVWTGVDAAAPAPGGLSFGFGATEFAPDGTLYLSSATRCAAQSAGSGCTRRWTGNAWVEAGGKLLAHNVVYTIGYGGGPQQYGGTSGLVFDGARLCTFGAFYLSNPSISRSTTGLACRPSLTSGDWTLQISGLIGSVSALGRTSGGALYAGGNLQQAGTTPVQNLVVQVGGAWLPVGGAPDGPVSALASDGAGGLYVGGRFQRVGGAPTDNVANLARFIPSPSDPSTGTWTSVGGGVAAATSGSGMVSNAQVLALAPAPGGGVYVGGGFAYVRPTLASASAQWLGTTVAFWNGSTWTARYGLPGSVLTLATGPDGTLYAGGSFDQTFASLKLGGVARWDAGAGVWTDMRSGVWSFINQFTGRAVRSLAFGAGGSFARAVSSTTTPASTTAGRAAPASRTSRASTAASGSASTADFRVPQWVRPAPPKARRRRRARRRFRAKSTPSRVTARRSTSAARLCSRATTARRGVA